MERKKLAILPLVLAGFVFVCGIAAFVVSIALGAMATHAAMQRMHVPGEQEVALEPGPYVLFHEHESDLDGETTRVPSNTALHCEIEGIALRPVGRSMSYTEARRKAVAIHRFRVAAPGRHVVRVKRADGQETPRTVVALSRNYDEETQRTAFLSFTILLGSMTLATVIAGAALLRWAFSR